MWRCMCMFWAGGCCPPSDRPPLFLTTTSTCFILWLSPFRLSALILARSSSERCRLTLLFSSPLSILTVADAEPAPDSLGLRSPPTFLWCMYFFLPLFMKSSPSSSSSPWSLACLVRFLDLPPGYLTLSSSSRLSSSATPPPSSLPPSSSPPHSGSGENLMGGGSSTSWKSTTSLSSPSSPSPAPAPPALFFALNSSRCSRHSAAASRICFTPALALPMAEIMASYLLKM
mmetsp:Transcript_26873/g.56150  ORF Transcript_26873/g.56150 Transcript_26873/m.56150 type:complete len:230 (-) Transcript_26873:2226-2915(-)